MLPGPYTFVLKATEVFQNCLKPKKTVGIRIPNHKIPQVLVNEIGNPILSTSVHDEDTIMDIVQTPN